MTYTKSAPETIQEMFGKIAARYDLCNKALSFNLHRLWNRTLVREILNGTPPSKILDLCAGTGDIAIEFAHQSKGADVTLLDFCAPMLDVAKEKAQSEAFKEAVFSYVEGDATLLPFNEGSFSNVSVAYGIRNIQNPLKCVQEAHRVLVPGGTLGILELTRPKNPLVGFFHSLYLKTFVPMIGSLVTQDKEAYQYLNKSIKQFQTASALERMLIETGFVNVRTIPASLGIASIIVGTKSPS
ncbi:bifunctional demethylmenaquinone methyltransferase/2-methoxy-6-polyprenyl-1,4-benzoquinol methylase UbiE [Estrella lausannensis]|uniref:Demethylmenaquinone methyltransferase n=1 Tax=Estrella lausannensis TaxID=483423 RepID=A0A0H5DP56_9BACT|nr:bifunctional demethylmenaquinone methyltransferase/2-methoxy-6-polyprenyl-1,4-benzoquinol methylase UbiE [Estrella lausannensis]CRX38142.1 Menaquinone biosynthesis methyltransferase [Estrella lausannensis]